MKEDHGLDPLESDKQALRDTAQAHACLGMHQEAIADCIKQIELDPKDPFSYIELGKYYEQSGDINGAEGVYKDTIKIFSNHYAAYINLGVLLEKHKKQFDQAIVCYEKALELNPAHYWSWNNIGAILQKKGLHQEAIAYYEKAYEISLKEAFEDAIFHIGHNLAWGYYRCKRYNESWHLFTDLIKDPSSDACRGREIGHCENDKACIYSDFGCLSYRLGHYQDARLAFEKALSFCPKSRYFKKLFKVAARRG